MSGISINNGASYISVSEAIETVGMDVIVSMMDEELREQVHHDIAPCTNEEFVEEYLRRSNEDIIIG